MSSPHQFLVLHRKLSLQLLKGSPPKPPTSNTSHCRMGNCWGRFGIWKSWKRTCFHYGFKKPNKTIQNPDLPSAWTQDPTNPKGKNFIKLHSSSYYLVTSSDPAAYCNLYNSRLLAVSGHSNFIQLPWLQVPNSFYFSSFSSEADLFGQIPMWSNQQINQYQGHNVRRWVYDVLPSLPRMTTTVLLTKKKLTSHLVGSHALFAFCFGNEGSHESVA